MKTILTIELSILLVHIINSHAAETDFKLELVQLVSEIREIIAEENISESKFIENSDEFFRYSGMEIVRVQEKKFTRRIHMINCIRRTAMGSWQR